MIKTQYIWYTSDHRTVTTHMDVALLPQMWWARRCTHNISQYHGNTCYTYNNTHAIIHVIWNNGDAEMVTTSVCDHRVVITVLWSSCYAHHRVVAVLLSHFCDHRAVLTVLLSPVYGHRVVVTVLWSQRCCHRFVVAGLRSPGCCHRFLVTCLFPLSVGHRVAVTVLRSLVCINCVVITVL